VVGKKTEKVGEEKNMNMEWLLVIGYWLLVGTGNDNAGNKVYRSDTTILVVLLE